MDKILKNAANNLLQFYGSVSLGSQMINLEYQIKCRLFISSVVTLGADPFLSLLITS